MRTLLSNLANATRRGFVTAPWAVLGVAIVILLVAGHSVHAAVITDDGTGKMRNERLMLGYDFTVGSSAVTVSALGIWDDSAADAAGGASAAVPSPDGLAEDHQIGLWRTSTGTLLGTVTVLAGTSGTLVGEFRYVTLSSPVVLLAGTQYTLGADYYGGLGAPGVNQPGPDFWHDTQTPGNVSVAVFGTSSDFNSFVGRGGFTGSFAIPNGFSAGAGQAYIGPNALYVVGVPEPTSMGLLALGSASLLMRKRSR